METLYVGDGTSRPDVDVSRSESPCVPEPHRPSAKSARHGGGVRSFHKLCRNGGELALENFFDQDIDLLRRVPGCGRNSAGQLCSNRGQRVSSDFEEIFCSLELMED